VQLVAKFVEHTKPVLLHKLKNCRKSLLFQSCCFSVSETTSHPNIQDKKLVQYVQKYTHFMATSMD
jgi:hypothetical protein